MASRTSPLAVTITPRRARFGRGDRTARWWLGGNPYGTALFNALSATFPKGEAFFIDTLRRFLADAPPKLAEDIRGFSIQEAIHGREHVHFNRRAADAGYDMSALFARVEHRLAIAATRPPVVNVAVTMSLEHFTAIFSYELLADPQHLADADPESRRMWRWHAIEEVEHKGVAYDTWLHATRGWPRWRRWLLKARVMLLVTRNFIVDRTAAVMALLRQDGITGPRAWFGFFWYCLVRPGIMRKVFAAWASFFMPGFHPWNRDDRPMIARADAELRAGG
jgi:predicted metal-dependent hydrolase